MEPLVAAREALARGERAVLVTVTGIEGEPPSREGLAFAYVEGGRTFGTLGCDGFDRAAAADAARALGSATRLESAYEWDAGSRILVEVRPLRQEDAVPGAGAEAEVLVVGGGPVARALEVLARTVGFQVRTAAPTDDLDAGRETYVVICGHDEEASQPALRKLLSSPAPYLGMMGSRRHTGHLLGELRAAGHSDSSLERVHTPVGLDLRAETPEEIALAALAHVVAVRRRGTGAPLA
ncbi:MAG: XdhC/CoxI family protein [Candidatus Limnocylindria bacterium]